MSYFVCIYRTSVLREIEMEDKRRKWYFDQLEDLQKKLESLPVSDTVSFWNYFHNMLIVWWNRKIKFTMKWRLGWLRLSFITCEECVCSSCEPPAGHNNFYGAFPDWAIIEYYSLLILILCNCLSRTSSFVGFWCEPHKNHFLLRTYICVSNWTTRLPKKGHLIIMDRALELHDNDLPHKVLKIMTQWALCWMLLNFLRTKIGPVYR